MNSNYEAPHCATFPILQLLNPSQIQIKEFINFYLFTAYLKTLSIAQFIESNEFLA
jgi:hypothetical protein